MPVTMKQRNRPPFPNLQSYNITCIILGYTGYSDEVRDLLSRLSHKTASYAETHAVILRGAIVKWEAKIVAIIQFDDASQSSTLTQKFEYKMTPQESSRSNKKTKKLQIRVNTRALSAYDGSENDLQLIPPKQRQRQNKLIMRK